MSVLLRVLFLLFISSMLTACDILLDRATDCLDNDRPQFNRKDLPVAVLNQEYEERISVSISNEPYDDWYNYRFTFKGELPAGLQQIRSDKRSIIIQGTPTETGSFSFTMTVRVDEPDSYPDYVNSGDYLYFDDSNDYYYDDGDDLCRDYRHRRFVIDVIEEDNVLID